MLERDSGSKVVIWIVERGRDPGLGSSRCNGSVRYITYCLGCLAKQRAYLPFTSCLSCSVLIN